MFNFLFIIFIGFLACLCGYRVWQLVAAMLEHSESVAEAEGREFLDVFSDVLNELNEVNEETYRFIRKLSPEREAKYNSTKNIEGYATIVMIVIAPIYAVISILGLIF